MRDATGSWLGRRNPTVKLGLLTVVSFVSLAVLDPWTPTLLHLLAMVGLLTAAALPLRVLLVAQLPVLAFASGVLVVNAVSRRGQVAAVIGPLVATHEGLAVGSALAARTLLVGLLAVGFVLTTDGVALMASLHQQARLPVSVTYAVLAGHRILLEMPREWTAIRQAHTVRVPGGRRRARQLPGTALALLVSSVRKGDRLARSLEARGLGSEPRTVWRPISVAPADWGLACLVLGVVAVVLAGAVVVGVAQGPSALTG